MTRHSFATLLIAASTGTVTPAVAETTLLNVSYDPTREFYRDYNAYFADWWTKAGNPPVRIEQSHGGSGSQARAVIDGLDAQIVTLALASDIDAIAEATGRIPEDWQSRLPHGSAPYTSTVVFLVRDGNPKGIADWDDLVRDDIQVITPNPKTSGGARWNFLAAWGWALRQEGGNDETAFAYTQKLFATVPVLDAGARGATTTFAQRGVGDVLLAWENEAFLSLETLGEDGFDIVVPSVSIRAEPPVALVEGNIAGEDQRAAAEAWLEQLYSPEAQAIAVAHHYRAWDVSVADPADVAQFPEVELFGIEAFGGWDEAQSYFFGNGGVFDRIYAE